MDAPTSFSFTLPLFVARAAPWNDPKDFCSVGLTHLFRESAQLFLLSQQFRVAITFNVGQVANLPDKFMPPF